MSMTPAATFSTKKEYAYTTGTLGTPTDTIVYTYDTAWKDKLLTYDGGATITYDEIGNPLTYNGYAFTWQKGRQLASAAIGAKVGSFIGSPGSVPGIIIGGLVGSAVGVILYAFTDVIPFNGKTVRAWTKERVNGLW